MTKSCRIVKLAAVLLTLCCVPHASAGYFNVVDLPDLNGSYSYGQSAVSQTVSIERPAGSVLRMVEVEFDLQGHAGSDSVAGEVYPELIVSVRDPEGVDLIEATIFGPIAGESTTATTANYWTTAPYVVGHWPPHVSGLYEVTLEMPDTYPGLISSPVMDVLSASITVEFTSDYGFVGLQDLDAVLGHWNQTVEPNNFMKGEFTGDGYIGLGDLDVLLANWNVGVPTLPIESTASAAGVGCAAYTDVYPPPPGCDDFIGLEELDTVLGRWNTDDSGNPEAGINGDGFVGLADLDWVLSNWNRRIGTGICIDDDALQAAAVPEPATVALFGTILLVTNRRRFHR